MKFGILRVLSPGHRLGVAWWLCPDQQVNRNGRHIGYLNVPERWRHFDPALFDALRQIVTLDRRSVRALEAADVLPGAIFAADFVPSDGSSGRLPQERLAWFARLKQQLAAADIVFVDPDNGLEPNGLRPGSSASAKSVLVRELRELADPQRCLIVYHHHTRRNGGHQAEMEHWVDRLRESGFRTADALRAKPYSPRVFFLLDAPEDVRQRASDVEVRWSGLISWHRDGRTEPQASSRPKPSHKEPRGTSGRGTTAVGFVNRHGQEVVRPTGRMGTDHNQYVYVLRCRTCGHEYGANGSDIFLRRCPAHDQGRPGLSF